MSELSLRDTRIQKLNRLTEIGMNPFEVEKFESPVPIAQLLNEFQEGKAVSIAGRLTASRIMGKAAFFHISDGEAKIQFYIRQDEVSEREWEAVSLLDLGDHVGITGLLFVTKTGERSVHVKTLTPLSKSLNPPPIGKEKDGETFYGLTDVDLRYRHRHLDLLANPEARKKLLDRSRIVTAVRRYFDSINYFEVETPLLQLEAGGAAARPFLTHYNAYDLDVKLRISLELYLKRVICGDVPRVYEIGRVFRNEGVDNRHNPEFTMLEFYEAYANLDTMMDRVEGMIRFVAESVFGTTNLDGIDYGKPWRRWDLVQAIEEFSGIKPDQLETLESARAAMKGAGLPIEKENNRGGILEKLLEHFVEPHLDEPTFILYYPIETSPLAKKLPGRPNYTRRFEAYVKKRELANAFSELNDPLDQRERFMEQVKERAGGNDEAHPLDEDFLFAVESGMPPTGGCGIGIDRLVMLLTGSDQLREILLFPMMKPVGHA